MAEAFFDTNILLYLLSADMSKADKAEDLIAAGGCISVQVLNEFASVASRKLRMPWQEIREVLEPIRAICDVIPLTVDIHDKALDIAQHYQFSIYDSLIVAAALDAGCKKLYSEDLQHGQVLGKTIRVMNPFVGL